jgi:hypothetical protein
MVCFARPLRIEPYRSSYFAPARSSSMEDPTPKRGDMTFALGNICWKVYDQVCFVPAPLSSNRQHHAKSAIRIAANLSPSGHHLSDVFDDPTLTSSKTRCTLYIASRSCGLLVLVWKAETRQGRSARGEEWSDRCRSASTRLTDHLAGSRLPKDSLRHVSCQCCQEPQVSIYFLRKVMSSLVSLIPISEITEPSSFGC